MMRTGKEFVGEILGPVMTGKQILFPMAGTAEIGQRLAGVESKYFYYDADINTELGLLSSMYFNVFPTFSWDAYNFEAEALGQAIIIGKYGMPDVDTSNPLMKSFDDLKNIKWPTENPLDAGKYPTLIRHNELVEHYTGMAPQLFTGAVSTFSLACLLMTFTEFARLIKKEPEKAHEVMRYLVDDIHTPLIVSVAEKYPGITFMFADAWEAVPNISPKTQEEFAFTYFDRLLENTKGVDATVGWWMSYGEGSMPDPAAYLKRKLQYNHRIARTCTEDCPGEVYHQVAVEADVPLFVHIPSLTILDGPEDKIIEFTREIAKTQRCGIAPEKFSWSALVPANAKIEHVLASKAAGNAFGVNPCPIPEEFDRIDVEVEKLTGTFEDFCRQAAKENPDGFTFKWLDQAEFSG